MDNRWQIRDLKSYNPARVRRTSLVPALAAVKNNVGRLSRISKGCLAVHHLRKLRTIAPDSGQAPRMHCTRIVTLLLIASYAISSGESPGAY
jgi:hypothetical protein